jgi:hypothetical protein
MEKGSCPLCEKQYNRKNRKTHHHIFPRTWYGNGVRVEVCQKCHQVEFNHLYPMNHKWSRGECLQNWSDFCKSKGKWMLKVYPELKNEVMGRI